jgi:hypothetical protein
LIKIKIRHIKRYRSLYTCMQVSVHACVRKPARHTCSNSCKRAFVHAYYIHKKTLKLVLPPVYIVIIEIELARDNATAYCVAKGLPAAFIVSLADRPGV